MTKRNAAIAALMAALGFMGVDAQPTDGARAMIRCAGTGQAADVDSLAAAIAAAPSVGAVLSAPADEELSEAAARASCDIAVNVNSESLADGNARSVWRIIDPRSGDMLADGAIEGREPTDRDLAEFWWIPIVEAVETALSAMTWVPTTVRAAAGTRISGLTSAPVTVPD